VVCSQMCVGTVQVWYKFKGVVSSVSIRGNFVLTSAVGSLDLVHCPEPRSTHFSEVVYVLQLW